MLRRRIALIVGLTFLLLTNTVYAASSGGITSIFHQFVDVFSNTIDYFYRVTNDYGVAILIVTLIIRIITLPFMIKQIRYSRVLQELQPKMKEIRAKYDGNQQKINEATMNLYKEYGANPLAGCLPMLIQLPILWAFYYAIRNDQALMSHKFLGLIILGNPDPTFILPLCAAATTFLQQKIMMANTDQQQKALLIMMPVMIFIMSWKLPAALPLYWFFSNLFTVVQTYFVRKMPPVQGGAQS